MMRRSFTAWCRRKSSSNSPCSGNTGTNRPARSRKRSFFPQNACNPQAYVAIAINSFFHSIGVGLGIGIGIAIAAGIGFDTIEPQGRSVSPADSKKAVGGWSNRYFFRKIHLSDRVLLKEKYSNEYYCAPYCSFNINGFGIFFKENVRLSQERWESETLSGVLGANVNIKLFDD